MTDAINHTGNRDFFALNAAELDHAVFQNRDRNGAYQNKCEIKVGGDTYVVKLKANGISVRRGAWSAIKHLFFGSRSAEIRDRLSTLQNQIRSRFDANSRAIEILSGVARNPQAENFDPHTGISTVHIMDDAVKEEADKLQQLGTQVRIPGDRDNQLTSDRVVLKGRNDVLPFKVADKAGEIRTVEELLGSNTLFRTLASVLVSGNNHEAVQKSVNKLDFRLMLSAIIDGKDLKDMGMLEKVQFKACGHRQPLKGEQEARQALDRFIAKNLSPSLDANVSGNYGLKHLRNVLSEALLIAYLDLREGRQADADGLDYIDRAILNVSQLGDVGDRKVLVSTMKILRQDVVKTMQDVVTNHTKRELTKLAAEKVHEAGDKMHFGVTGPAQPQEENGEVRPRPFGVSARNQAARNNW